MYPYIGSLNEMKWIPTAAGTLKPTCLVPKTIDVARLKETDTIYIVGFHCLKDYYAELVAKNLKISLGSEKKYEVVMINHQFSGGRDVTVLDLARWLDTEAGRAEFIKELKGKVKPGSVALIPPILGTASDYLVLDAVEKAMGCHFIETVTVPPSLSGLRLRSMLINRLKKMGVRMIEKANVIKSILEERKCVAVVTDGIDRQRSYYAQNFILATGGFYGGGLISVELGEVNEPIFNIPIQIPIAQEEWSNLNLFSNKKQPFAKIGITTDEKMHPLDIEGNLLFENVFVAGRNLQGYDFCFEKSGNGVALASGYQAAMSV
jgi:glycerol-3-phosphate dehydrogenase subunit B